MVRLAIDWGVGGGSLKEYEFASPTAGEMFLWGVCEATGWLEAAVVLADWELTDSIRKRMWDNDIDFLGV